MGSANMSTNKTFNLSGDNRNKGPLAHKLYQETMIDQNIEKKFVFCVIQICELYLWLLWNEEIWSQK
jgi:hypothetical protein